MVASEKVPTDVGRPGLRVTPTDEYASLSVSEITQTVDATMAERLSRLFVAGRPPQRTEQ